MQVTITVDPEYVAAELMEKSTFVDIEGDVVDGSFQNTIDAVISQLSFTFDRPDIELAAVLQFPELTR